MTSSTPLPLPQQYSEIVAADPELEQTWESVNVWCEGFLRCDEEREKKQELRRVAGHIQLACKFLSIRLKESIQAQAENSLAKASALKTLRQVHVVAKWIGGFPVVHEFYRWGPTSSLKVAVDAALPLYDNLIPEKADTTIPLHELYAPMERLVDCKRVWDNIHLFCNTGTDTSVIKMEEIKRRLAWLEGQIERQKLRDSIASPKAPEVSSLSGSVDESLHDSAEIM